MRIAAAAVVAALFFAFPATGAAKEVKELVVCGAEFACVTFTDPGAMHSLLDAVATGQEPSGIYYTVDLTVDAERDTHTMMFRYDPVKNIILPAGPGTGWMRLTDEPPARFLRALAAIEPFGKERAKGDGRAHAAVTGGDDSFPWLFAALAVAGAAALGLVLVRRRRPAHAAK